MKIIRYLCIILFIIIIVLFTVGYASQPIINLNAVANIKMPLLPDGTPVAPDTNEKIEAILYIDKVIVNNTTIYYSDINSSVNDTSNSIKYAFIFASICIGLVIGLSFIGMKRISYIPLVLSQLIMISFTSILIIIYNTNYLSDIISNLVNSQDVLNSNGAKVTVLNVKINYDIGAILITLSTALLIINHFLYSILG